ncbi:hypothetical protein NPIL_214711 [Nephila pilipes]|uniref:Uncharacterized protein n=1 Tax=Nephila pilipes TaxID=299642 RepID=A0A8X6N8N1_NEPPI|nr:hypothetical protein NPIL_214711 [Nephila pilipes]
MGPGAVMYTNGLSKSTEFSASLFTLQITQSKLPNKYITKVGIVLDMLCYVSGNIRLRNIVVETIDEISTSTTTCVIECKTSCEGMKRYVTSIMLCSSLENIN